MTNRPFAPSYSLAIPFGVICIVAQLDEAGACWLDRPRARGANCLGQPACGDDACRFDSMEIEDAFRDAEALAPVCGVAS